MRYIIVLLIASLLTTPVYSQCPLCPGLGVGLAMARANGYARRSSRRANRYSRRAARHAARACAHAAYAVSVPMTTYYSTRTVYTPRVTRYYSTASMIYGPMIPSSNYPY